MIRTQKIGPATIFFGRYLYYPYCNTLLIKDEQTLLVDPSCDEEALKAVARDERIDFLFNTHYHGDHRRYNNLFDLVPLLIHKMDAPCLRSLDTMAEWIGIRGTEYEGQWRNILARNNGYYERKDVQEIEDGMTLSLGQTTVQFIHLPGHTPGHTGLLLPDAGIFLLADMELSPYGPWYGNQVASIEQIIQSVEKIRKIPADTFIPSHGKIAYRGDIGPRLDRYLGNIYAREERIIRLLEAPATLDQLAAHSPITGLANTKKHIGFFFERQMVEKHLTRLLVQGKISRAGDQYRREV